MATRAKRRKAKANENPLWLHKGTGQWTKKIKGRFVYFGEDLQSALKQYESEKASWQAGINPREEAVDLGDDPTVADICNAYLTSQSEKVEAQELSPRTFREQEGTCKAMADHFGRQRRVSGMKPQHFAPFRAKLAKKYGPTRLANEIVRARSIFKYAYENDFIEKPVKFGTQFKVPPKKQRRAHLNKKKQELEPLTAAELRTVIDAAGTPLKAMILLGINCAYGSADIGTLPRVAIDLDAGWVEHPRAKTAVPRRAALWPETISAVQDAMANRPDPETPEDDSLAFLTTFGRPWYRVSDTYEDDDGKLKGGVPIDSITKEWDKLLRNLELKRKGIGFYHLRHLFQTVGEESHDTPAVTSLMGHVDDSMADPYRINIRDERLQLVTDHVRSWLYDGADDDTDNQPATIKMHRSATA